MADVSTNDCYHNHACHRRRRQESILSDTGGRSAGGRQQRQQQQQQQQQRSTRRRRSKRRRAVHITSVGMLVVFTASCGTYYLPVIEGGAATDPTSRPTTAAATPTTTSSPTSPPSPPPGSQNGGHSTGTFFPDPFHNINHDSSWNNKKYYDQVTGSLLGGGSRRSNHSNSNSDDDDDDDDDDADDGEDSSSDWDDTLFYDEGFMVGLGRSGLPNYDIHPPPPTLLSSSSSSSSASSSSSPGRTNTGFFISGITPTTMSMSVQHPIVDPAPMSVAGTFDTISWQSSSINHGTEDNDSDPDSDADTDDETDTDVVDESEAEEGEAIGSVSSSRSSSFVPNPMLKNETYVQTDNSSGRSQVESSPSGMSPTIRHHPVGKTRTSNNDGTMKHTYSSSSSYSPSSSPLQPSQPSRPNDRSESDEERQRNDDDSSSNNNSNSNQMYRRPLQTIERLQQLLDDTDYMTSTAGSAEGQNEMTRSAVTHSSESPLVPPRSLPPQPPQPPTPPQRLQDSSARSSQQQQQQQPQQQQQQQQQPTESVPNPLWTSQDRAKYKKQQRLQERKQQLMKQQQEEMARRQHQHQQQQQQQQLQREREMLILQQQQQQQQQQQPSPIVTQLSDIEDFSDTDNEFVSSSALLNLPVYLSDDEESDEEYNEDPGHSAESDSSSLMATNNPVSGSSILATLSLDEQRKYLEQQRNQILGLQQQQQQQQLGIFQQPQTQQMLVPPFYPPHINPYYQQYPQYPPQPPPPSFYDPYLQQQQARYPMYYPPPYYYPPSASNQPQPYFYPRSYAMLPQDEHQNRFRRFFPWQNQQSSNQQPTSSSQSIQSPDIDTASVDFEKNDEKVGTSAALIRSSPLQSALSLLLSWLSTTASVLGGSLKVTTCLCIVLAMCFASVSPRSLPLVEYNEQFYSLIGLAACVILPPLVGYGWLVIDWTSRMITTTKKQRSGKLSPFFNFRKSTGMGSAFIDGVFGSFIFGYVRIFVTEIVLTTLVRMAVFSIWEQPDIFSHFESTDVPPFLIPWVLQQYSYKPKRITLLAADFISSCVVCPIVEEWTKLRLLVQIIPLNKNFVWTKCDGNGNEKQRKKTGSDGKRPIAKPISIDDYEGERKVSVSDGTTGNATVDGHVTNVNTYVSGMLAISLGLKWADSIRRVCMYTKPSDSHKELYAFLRGLFPVQELCGIMTALRLARRDVLGQSMSLWQLLLPAIVIHGMASFRGMKPIFKWNSPIPWAEMQLSPNMFTSATLDGSGAASAGMTSPASVSSMEWLGQNFPKIMWLIILGRVAGYCVKNYYMINRQAVKRETTYAGKHAAFSAELEAAEKLKMKNNKGTGRQ